MLDTDFPVETKFDTLPDATTRRAFVRTLRAVVDWRGQVVTMLDRAYLARALPTLLVWGDRDPVLPVAPPLPNEVPGAPPERPLPPPVEPPFSQDDKNAAATHDRTKQAGLMGILNLQIV